MLSAKISCLAFCMIFLGLFPDNYAYAAAPVHVRWNQANWLTRAQPKIISFGVASNGTATGVLADGSYFTQSTIYQDGPIKIQKFVLEDYSHFVVNGLIMYDEDAIKKFMNSSSSLVTVVLNEKR